MIFDSKYPVLTCIANQSEFAPLFIIFPIHLFVVKAFFLVLIFILKLLKLLLALFYIIELTYLKYLYSFHKL